MPDYLHIKLLLLTLAFSFFLTAIHSEVLSQSFSTQYCANNFKFPYQFKKQKKLFENSLHSLPEGLIIQSVLTMGGKQLTLSTKQIQTLGQHVFEIYQEISQDQELKTLASALPYCYSNKNKEGHYFLYLPEKIPKHTILFLHGDGGNFLFYLWTLKKNFPDSNIIIPSYGASWNKKAINYLFDMLSDIRSKKFSLNKKIWLMSISGSGPTGFDLLNSKQRNQFRGYICLASSPNLSQVHRISSRDKIMMINGKKDKRISYAKVKKRISPLLSRRNFKWISLNVDHFFFMTQPESCFPEIKKFMTTH